MITFVVDELFLVLNLSSNSELWCLFEKVRTHFAENHRFLNVPIALVDPSGIEPEPRQCECRVMPFYYGPTKTIADPR